METQNKAPVIRRADKGEQVKITIPICCVEGHSTCPHVAKPVKSAKRNIGL